MLYELGYCRKEINELLMRDVYLIFHGRVNKINSDEQILKKATAILSEVFNKSMGGNGVIDAVDKMWLIGQDPPKQMTAEEIRAHRKKVLEYHEKKLAEKRKAV